MVLPILVAVGASVAAGYAMDHIFGDGNYTKRELATDAVLGIFGVSAVKAGAKAGGAVIAGTRARKAAKAGNMTDAGAYARASNTLMKSAAVDTSKGIILTEAVHAVVGPESPTVNTSTVTVGGSAAVSTPLAIAIEPGLARRQIRNAKKGVLPTKNRCTRTYRGRQCVRTWPHPGKHMYV